MRKLVNASHFLFYAAVQLDRIQANLPRAQCCQFGVNLAGCPHSLQPAPRRVVDPTHLCASRRFVEAEQPLAISNCE